MPLGLGNIVRVSRMAGIHAKEQRMDGKFRRDKMAQPTERWDVDGMKRKGDGYPR